MSMKSLCAGLSMATFLVLAGCGKQEAETPAGAADSDAPATPAALPRTASAAGASVFFITPEDGAMLSNPVSIEFGIDGMQVVAAGVNDTHSGHHHLLVDTGLPALDLPIPADANHIHFGDGSTATTLELAPGTHTLQLLLGDHLHIPHSPPVASEVITVTVK